MNSKPRRKQASRTPSTAPPGTESVFTKLKSKAKNSPAIIQVITAAMAIACILLIWQPKKPVVITQPQVYTAPGEETSASAIDSTDSQPDLIPPTPTPEAKMAPPKPQFQIRSFVVADGDNLSKLFYKAGLTDRDVYLFTKQGGDIKAFTRINVGQTIDFKEGDNGLISVSLHYNKLESLVATKNGADQSPAYAVKKIILTPTIKYEEAQGTIESSLFLAAKKAHISDRLAMELSNIFGWDVDFALDIRQGDRFKIVYEKKYLNGEFLGDGDIVAASFDNQSKHFEAVRYTDSNGNTDYHSPDGRSMRKAFLRTPVDYTRISSQFNLKRRHPVLHTIRAHKGTDYAAKRGTPIKSAGDGKVIFRGRKGGWGNTIIIKHGTKYKTLYAHQSKFARGLKVGSRVKQGQVIGYVGMSGLATGPHLHYEFYVNGQVRNPVTVKLPQADPISTAELTQFKAKTRNLLALLREPVVKSADLISVGS